MADKWAFEGNNVVAYHGTSQSRVQKIKAEGIKHNAKRNYPGHGLYQGSRKGVVFLAGNPDDAKEWARGKNTTVLKVHVPKDDPRLDRDPSDNTEASYRGTIPPHWIKD